MKYCYFTVLCIISINLHAQTPRKDNPQPGTRSAGTITNLAKKYIDQCEHYRYTRLDSLNTIASQLFELGKKYKVPLWQSWAELYFSIYHTLTGQSDRAIQLAQKNIPVLKENEEDDILLGRWYSTNGLALMKSNRQREALNMFYAAMRLFEQKDDKEAQFRTSNNIGWAFMELNQYEKAIENFKKAIRLLKENNLPDRYGTPYNNLAACYGSLGHFDSAYQYAHRGITIAEKYNDHTALANGLNIKGTFLAKQNRYPEALASFMQAKPIREKIGDPFYIVSDLAEIAELQAKTGDTAEGIRNCMEAITLIKKNKLEAKLPLVYTALAHNYKVSGNYKAAAETYQMLNQLKDELYANANPAALADIQTKYETEKKENLIQQQQFAITRQNYWIAGIVGALILGGLLTWSLYRRRRLQQDTRLQEKTIQQQELITHAVLEAEENERQRIAKDLHDGIGQMMSAAKMNLSAIENEILFPHENQKIKFNRIITLLDESCKEVRAVSHNMMPNVLSKSGLGSAVRAFIDQIDNNVLIINLYHEGLNERLNTNVETIMYRIIQECVNNVLKHSAAGYLNISLMKDKEGISATIEDNGVGFDVANASRFEGMGLKNIRTRVEYLKGTVEFDSRPGNGTLVAIHVPLQETRP